MFDPYKTVPLTKFHEELWFEFQNLPTELFDYYLLRTARDMAEKAPLVRRKVKIPLRDGVTRYHLSAPDGLDLKSILDIRHVPTGNIEQGSKKVPRFFNAPEHLNCFVHGAWFDKAEETLTLHLPNCCGYCLVVVTTVPSRDACELPSEYYDNYLTTLIMGTKAQILMISGRPWTNLRVGSDLQDKYVASVSALGVGQLKNNQNGIVRMRAGKVL